MSTQGKADYHIHTCRSGDCRVPVRTAVDTAVARGLDIIAITDHNTILGGLEAQEYARGKPVLVIVGAEIKTDMGEVVGLWLNRPVVSHAIGDVIAEIKAQGGKVVVPHPFGMLRRNRLKAIERYLSQIDFIEVYNGRNVFGNGKRIAEYAAQHGIPAVVGSDAHFAFEIGNTGQDHFNWRGWLGYLLTAVLKRTYFLVRPFSHKKRAED